MAVTYDPAGINLTADLPAIAQRYGNVIKNGNEWKILCPFHADTDPSGTLYQKGEGWRFKCFACGAAHDAISFTMAMESCTFPEACAKLTNGGNGAHPITPPLRKAPPRITSKPPQDCLPPPFATKQGEPSRLYPYLDADGELLGYAAQYDAGLAYWTWGTRSKADPPKWEKRRFNPATGGVPLFGLEQLSRKPTAQVLVCHDERTAEAATVLFPMLAVVCWPGGDHAQTEADWTPILNRDKPVILLPRNDQISEHCMAKLAVHLYKLGVIAIKGINTNTYEHEGATVDAPQGWSVADAEGWTDALGWAKPRVFPYSAPQGYEGATEQQPVEIPTPTQNAPQPSQDDALPLDAYADEQTKITEPAPQDASPAPISEATLPKRRPNWHSFGYSLTEKGAPIMSLDNALRALEHDPTLASHVWYDEFLDAIITDWNAPQGKGAARQWADADDVALCGYMQRYLGLTRLSVGQAHDAALLVAMHNRRNECKDWLTSLEWDGTERLPDMLSDGFGAEHNAYTKAVGRCWMVSMVARVMRPGCQVDTVPVLEGEQGTFKSSALSVLGGKWFIEAHESVMTKDFFGVLNGHMIAEVSEMHSFTRAEVERIKGVISCRVDRYRKAYGRNTEDHPRHTVLVCTTNRDDWQRDDTGARRFWPIRCGHISLDYLTTNREQLFAEAVHRYQHDEPWWDVPNADQRNEVEQRREVDSWERIIAEFVASRQNVTIEQILSDCLNIELSKHETMMQRRVARLLRVTGWETKPIREKDGKVRRVWVMAKK